jgi:hypothetical protein
MGRNKENTTIIKTYFLLFRRLFGGGGKPGSNYNAI